MIAEKAADMIKGKQLDPYEPDQGKADEAAAAAASHQHLRQAQARSSAPAPSPPTSSSSSSSSSGQQQQAPSLAARSLPAAKVDQQLNQTSPASVYLAALNQINQEQHHQFMHAKYGSSMIGDKIIERIL